MIKDIAFCDLNPWNPLISAKPISKSYQKYVLGSQQKAELLLKKIHYFSDA